MNSSRVFFEQLSCFYFEQEFHLSVYGKTLIQPEKHSVGGDILCRAGKLTAI